MKLYWTCFWCNTTLPDHDEISCPYRKDAANLHPGRLNPDNWYEYERHRRDLEQRIEDLKERLEKALGLLRRMEWAASQPDECEACPICYRDGRSVCTVHLGMAVHADDCELAAMLRGEK